MSVLSNFDINNSFWSHNPLFKALGPFAKLYRNDKSKDKNISSKLCWAVTLFADVSKENKLANYSEKDRKKLIKEDYLRDESFNWSKAEEYIKFYQESQITPKKRQLYAIKRKMDERTHFIDVTPFDFGTARDLDSILANTDKLFTLITKLEQEIEKEEQSGGDTKGGRIESISETGTI